MQQLQLEKLTASFQCVTEDLRRQFMVDGEPLLHENSIGSSPILSSSFRRTTGFNIPTMSTSGVSLFLAHTFRIPLLSEDAFIWHL